MRQRRFLSWLLTLCLLLGMFSFPAYAEGNTTTISGDGTADKTGTMTITLVVPKKTPAATDLTYTAPSDLTYSGSAKAATVAAKDGVTGLGTITVKYYSDADRSTEVTETKNVGTYYVGATVAEGDQYAASTAVLYGDGWTFTITASTPDAPAAPTKASATKNSITLNAVSGCEYSKDGVNWQSGTEFTGLNPGTEYTFYQRVKATANTNASAASNASFSTEADTYAMTITLTIKEMEVSAENVSVAYDGQPHGITVNVTDPNSGYTVKYGTVEGTYDLDASPTQTEVGTQTVYYQVTANNYVTKTGSATVTISEASAVAATVTANNRTYDGTDKPLVNVDDSTLVGGEMQYALGTATEATEQYTTSIPTATNAGTYYVWYKAVGDANHNDSTAACATVTVAQKALTITADSDSKVYDTTALTKNSYDNTALATGDSIESVTVTGSQTTVGSSTNVPSAAVIKKGNTDVTANYEITYANGTLTVTKAMTNTVTVDITGWTYGDSANAPSSTADFGADTVVYTYSDKADGTFTAAVPGHAGLWFVKASVPGTANYAEGSAIMNFNIEKKAVTVTAEAKSKTYGDADPALTYVATGLVGNDALTGTLSRIEGNDFGTYAITQGTVDSNDYAITYVGAQLTINRREIVISGIAAEDKDYDGETNATLDYKYVTYGNIVEADAGKLSVSAVGTFADAQIGKGKTVTITGLTLSGDAAGNYVLAAEGQQEATTADICELENVTTDTNFVGKVKNFEGQAPTVTGLDLALALSLLTPAELAQYTAGEKLELDLEINKAGALMTEDVVTLVTNALKSQEKAKLDGAYYMDVTLYLKVGNAAPRKITSLGGKKISIKIDVPEYMYNHIWENKRTFYVVGVHSGVATVHASTTDHQILCDIGEFSVFALCYADVNVITYPSKTVSGTAATTAVTTVSPKTGGEDASEKLLLLMGTISAMIAIAAKVYEFRRRKEEE